MIEQQLNQVIRAGIHNSVQWDADKKIHLSGTPQWGNEGHKGHIDNLKLQKTTENCELNTSNPNIAKLQCPS